MQKLIMLSGILALALGLTGCAAVESITTATREKTVAAGSDTWGGGGQVSAATVETPVPTFEFWFGRRKVWYASVKDKDTGDAAAKIVKASNSSLEAKAGTDGLEVRQ